MPEPHLLMSHQHTLLAVVMIMVVMMVTLVMNRTKVIKMNMKVIVVSCERSYKLIISRDSNAPGICIVGQTAEQRCKCSETKQ